MTYEYTGTYTRYHPALDRLQQRFGPHVLKRIVRERKRGMTYLALAQKYGCSIGMIHAYCRYGGVRRVLFRRTRTPIRSFDGLIRIVAAVAAQSAIDYCATKDRRSARFLRAAQLLDQAAVIASANAGRKQWTKV